MFGAADVDRIPLELRLSVHRIPISRAQGADSLTGAFDEAVRLTVFKRDHFTCRCCGFRSLKYQQVVARNGNPRDVDAMFTACLFCHQCFDLELVTKLRSGVLVWMPEFEQAVMHHLARDIYRARITTGPMAVKARRLLDRWLSSAAAPRTQARERLGTDDPAVLAKTLRDTNSGQPGSSRHAIPGGIRLFPLDRRIVRESDVEFNMFPQVLAYWRSRPGPFPDPAEFRWLTEVEE
jgi:intracellular multiplication protein IcmJ